VFTKARHLLPVLSLVILVDALPTVFLIAILILSSHLHPGIPSCLLPLGFSYKNPIRTSGFPHTCHTPAYHILHFITLIIFGMEMYRNEVQK